MSQRSSAVTIFGGLNLVFGLLGVLGLCLSIPSLLLSDMLSGSKADPVSKAILQNPFFKGWTYASFGVGTVQTIMLIVAGIGLLKYKNWARRLSIAYSVLAILLAVVGAFMSYKYLIEPLQNSGVARGGPNAFMGVYMTAVMAGSTIFGIAYPVVLLIFMLRPSIVAACQPVVVDDPVLENVEDHLLPPTAGEAT